MKNLTAHSFLSTHAYVLIALLMLLALASPMRAQDLDSAAIGGRILDQNGAVIPGATIGVCSVAAHTFSSDVAPCGGALDLLS